MRLSELQETSTLVAEEASSTAVEAVAAMEEATTETAEVEGTSMDRTTTTTTTKASTRVSKSLSLLCNLNYRCTVDLVF